MMVSERTDALLHRAVLIVCAAVIVVLSLMTIARPTQWTVLRLAVPIPTLTSQQQYDRLMDKLYTAVDENDRGEMWRILDEIDKLLGRQWPPTPVQVDVVCGLCAELDCSKDTNICAWCLKHRGR